jgi:hypothetical protein
LGILLISGQGLILAASILSLVMGGVYIVIRLFKTSVLPPLFYKEDKAAGNLPQ